MGKESPDFGIAFIKPDNSLWLAGKDSDMVSSKLMDNVASIAASFTYYPNHIEILKTDGSVWGFSVSYSYTSDKWEFNDASKVTDNVKQIKAGYVIKNDNSLWSTLTEEEKIMDDVLYLTIGGYTPVSNRLYDRNQYFVLIKTDGSLWQGHEVREMNKIADNAAWAAVQDDKGAFIDTDGNLYYWDCDNIKSKQDMIFLTDNVKDIAFRSVVGLMDLLDSKIFTGSSKFRDKNGFFELDLIKNDGSLWRYLPEGEQRESYKYSKIEKLGDWTFE